MRALLLALLLTTPFCVHAQEPADEAAAGPTAEGALEIVSVAVEPSPIAVDTLARLRVTIRNGGDGDVTALAFTVEVGGVELPVYERQLFLERMPPGASTEIALYNFWSTETGRPELPAKELPVVVTLTEARHVTIQVDDAGDETWDLGEAVAGLPVSKRVAVPVAAP